MKKYSTLCALALSSTLILSACAGDDQIVLEQGVGVTATLSACPTVGVATYTGDVTVFDPVDSRLASAIDVTAQITNLRDTCKEQGDRIYVEKTFDVQATRRDASVARQVTLPYYSAVVRADTAVVSKRLGSVTLNFPAGSYRASAQGKAASYINKAAATLPADVVSKITAKRRSGDVTAAIDPLTDPTVQAALRRTRFEVLVGFQLTEDQLRYNATR